MPRGGKRKGAGRKPSGGHRKLNFSTRIDAELREELKRAAARNKRSLSNEIERRLEQSCEKDEKPRRWEPHNHGLAELIVLAAQAAEFHTEKRWIEDPYTFHVLRKAISFLLGYCEPSGPIETPARIIRIFGGTSPELLAEARGYSLDQARQDIDYQQTTAGMGQTVAQSLWMGIRINKPATDWKEVARTSKEYLARVRIRELLGVAVWEDRDKSPYSKG